MPRLVLYTVHALSATPVTLTPFAIELVYLPKTDLLGPIFSGSTAVPRVFSASSALSLFPSSSRYSPVGLPSLSSTGRKVLVDPSIPFATDRLRFFLRSSSSLPATCGFLVALARRRTLLETLSLRPANVGLSARNFAARNETFSFSYRARSRGVSILIFSPVSISVKCI